MKKKTYIIFSFVLLILMYGCAGYKPIFNSTDLNFKIISHSIEGNKILGKNIYSKLFNSARASKNKKSLNITDSKIESIIKDLSVYNLNLLKWFFSMVFIFIYLVITILLSKIIFNKNGYRLFISTTLFLSSIALLFYILCLNSESLSLSYTYYYISIELSHFIQSSLIVISLLMIFKVYLLFKASANK